VCLARVKRTRAVAWQRHDVKTTKGPEYGRHGGKSVLGKNDSRGQEGKQCARKKWRQPVGAGGKGRAEIEAIRGYEVTRDPGKEARPA